MSVTRFEMTAPPESYRRRRSQLAARLTRPMLIFAGMARSRKYATNTQPFRAAPNYLYYGGPPVEGACWLIEPGGDGVNGCTLFRRPTTIDDCVWTGPGASDESIADAAGIEVRAVADADTLGEALAGRPVCCVQPPCPQTMAWAARLGADPPADEELAVVVEQRLIKDERELAAMTAAAEIGIEAQKAAAGAALPGANEADVAAAVHAVLVSRRAEPSFTPIVTVRGEVLHADAYVNRLGAGDLLLVDLGAEEPTGYASDMTRTYPVGGRFDDTQRALYETVLRAEQAAVAGCVPGARFRDLHDMAGRILCEGLIDAGLLRGAVDELFERRAHTLFFPHGLGHLIGLDVHDMEQFGDLAGYAPGRKRRSNFGDKFLRLDRDLEPGMTVTIEPGIYLVPAIWNQSGLAASYADCVDRGAVDRLLSRRFGGIRLEDTVVIREDGPELLTGELPILVEDVQKMVCAARA